MDRGGVVQYLLTDHLHSTSVVVNADGSVDSQARYLPYGKERWSSGTLSTDYRFTGQRQIDSAGGIYHMGARSYDSALGRWTSPDSIIPDPTNPQSLNRYSYTRNNPVKFRDPSGHMEIYGGSYQPYSDYWHAYVNPGASGCQSDSDFINQAASLAVDFTPVLGDAKGLAEGVVGKDFITGESLGPVQRVLSVLFLSELRHGDEAINLIKAASGVNVEWLAGLAKQTENHHWIPRQFHKQLKQLFPDIAADSLHFTESLEKTFHKFLHGKGGALADAYNGRIVRWVDRYGTTKTFDEFLQFVGEVREEYLDLYEEYLTIGDDY